MEGDRTAFVTGPRMEVLEVRPTSRHDVKMAGITVECPLLHTATGCGEGNRPVHPGEPVEKLTPPPHRGPRQRPRW